MIRKYDYVEEKEDEEFYNFVQDSFDQNQDFDFAHQQEQVRKKSRSMHVTIDADEGIRYERQTKFRSRKNNFSKYIQSSNSKEQENAARRSNFIYHKTIDKFKDQIYSIRIKQGIQQIALSSKMPKLISSLSSNKKISSISEKEACAMERRLKNRLQLAQKLKTITKRKPPISSQPVGGLPRETVRQTLDRRIKDINKIVVEDAGSINLRIQEMDPINQMHRIRMIMEKGHQELQLVGEENGGIEQNIYDVRQLMRKYLKEG